MRRMASLAAYAAAGAPLAALFFDRDHLVLPVFPVDRVELAILFLGTLVGGIIQGAIGFGINLVVVPMVALVGPEALPGVPVLLGLPMAMTMLRHPQGIDRSGVAWVLTGRIPGTMLGAWVVTAVSATMLSALAGCAVLVAVGISLLGMQVRVDQRSCLVAGFASGVMNTTAGIGGPPLALLYQHHDGPVVRSTLAASFLFGTLLSIAMLAATGSLHLWQIVLTGFLTPAAVLGGILARRMQGWLDSGWLRPAVLAFGALSAVATILNGLGGHG